MTLSASDVAGESASSDVNAFLDIFVPLAGKTDDSKSLRKTAWPSADTSGNGILSLGMVKQWVQRKLASVHGQERGTALSKKYSPISIRAFHAAKEGHESNQDFVTPSEFRLLIAYLCVYALAFDAFDVIEHEDAGGNDDYDQRMSRTKWLAGCRKVSNHGFVALAEAAGPNATDESLGELFDHIHDNGKGMVLLVEWCDYLKDTETAAGTLMGSLIAIGGSSGGGGANKEKAIEVQTSTESTDSTTERSLETASGEAEFGKVVESQMVAPEQDVPQPIAGESERSREPYENNEEKSTELKEQSAETEEESEEVAALSVPELGNVADESEQKIENASKEGHEEEAATDELNERSIEAKDRSVDADKESENIVVSSPSGVVSVVPPTARKEVDPSQPITGDGTQPIAGDGASTDVKAFLDVFLPLAYSIEKSTSARQSEWVIADTNSEDQLSLSTVERWIQRRLCDTLDKNRGMELYKMFFPAFTRAFNGSRDVPAALHPDYVNRSEFRLLIAYLCVYALAFDAFSLVDSPDGYATGRRSDRRDQKLSRTEWLMGCRKVANHGFIALANAVGPTATEESLADLFDLIDENGGGTIQLTEWCNYLEQTEVAAGTPMGVFLSIGAGGDKDPLLTGKSLGNGRGEMSENATEESTGNGKSNTLKRAYLIPTLLQGILWRNRRPR
jgi:hypothetical protein